MSNSILINTVIEWSIEDSESSQLERVLCLNAAADIAVLFSLSDKKALPVFKKLSDLEIALRDGEAIKRVNEPFGKIARKEESIPLKYRIRRDTAWNAIKDIVEREPDIYDEETRWSLICEAAERYKLQPKTILKYLRRYWRYGQVKNALLPEFHNCGGRDNPKETSKRTKKRGRKPKALKVDSEATGVNIDEVIQKIFLVAIRLFYDRRNPRPPLSRAYRKMLNKFFNKGFRTNETGKKVPIFPPVSTLPTYGQFHYWFKVKRDLKKSLIARHGEKGFARSKREKLGEATSRALAPGDIFEFDSTIGDIYLVNSLMRWALIGRPVIYVVIDVFSRLIVGLHVALRGPCWEEAAMALYYAFTDKVAFCANYGEVIRPDEWPAHHLCNGVWADHAEMRTEMSDRLPESSLNIKIIQPPSYRPDWKPIVEQSFNILNNESIHWLPGGFAFWEREKEERDYPLDGRLTLRAFTRVLINNVIAYNHGHYLEDYPFDEYMIQDNIVPTPINLWNWGILHKGRIREKQPQIIKQSLLPRHNISVTASGIAFNNASLFYTNTRAKNEQWFIQARNNRSWVDQAFCDPRQLSNIYMINSKDESMESCELLKKSSAFKSAFLEEIQDFKEIRDIQAKSHQTSKFQVYAECDAKNDAIIAEEKRETEAAIPKGMSKRKRIVNMREYRAEEQERIQKERVIKDALADGAGSRILRLMGSGDSASEVESPEIISSNRQQRILEIMRRNRADKQ